MNALASTKLTSRKVVLATFGTLGDIYPFIAIASALRARGFDPLIAAPDMYRPLIEGERIAFGRLRPHETDIFDALGVDSAGAFQLMLKNPHFIFDEIYMRFLSETYEDVMREAKDARLIITHSLLVGAHQAAEMLKIPSARVALAPLHLQSATDPSLTPSAPYVACPKSKIAHHYNRVVRAAVRTSVNLRSRRLHALRRKIGLPPTWEDFFLDFGRPNKADAIFGLFSPLFAPPQDDQPENLSVTGFPFLASIDPARSELSPDLSAFLSAGTPPVIFTLGSFAPDVSGDFYDQSLRAARDLSCRAVLLSGPKDMARLKSQVGPTEHVCAQAPHGLLFPKGLCVVHHGGIGTTAEAMRAGKPQIVVPFFGDQPDHGARIERLGLGFIVSLSAYNHGTAASALLHLTSGPYRDRAADFAKRIASERGVEAIVDWAESQVNSAKPR